MNNFLQSNLQFLQICLFTFLPGVVLYLLSSILSGVFVSYTLPFLIGILYIYLLIFESGLINLPIILQNYLPDYIYTPILFILYVLYISQWQI